VIAASARRARCVWLAQVAALGLAACAGGTDEPSGDGATRDAAASADAAVSAADAATADAATADADTDAGERDASALPYAREVIRFEPGDHAGYGEDSLPDVVLGPPVGKGTGRGGLDVLSLGVGGEIVLGFGERTIVDGDGPDFIVFENAFWVSNDPSMVYAEPGEVAVSEDGETWHTFACRAEGDGDGHFDGDIEGCAGWSPTLAYDPSAMPELDPAHTGGDAFDLADLDVERARFVRVRDKTAAGAGQGTSGGFDLDAIGVVHAE
jgi:hypothetical protein